MRNAQRSEEEPGNRVSQFESLRPHLMSVAYRLTGTVTDAEDIVQEAWLRWAGMTVRSAICVPG